ncbi:MAG: hypothetical protein ACE5JL_18140 [Dehalococcoidia bacterium]
MVKYKYGHVQALPQEAKGRWPVVEAVAANRMVQMSLVELQRQLKEAALYYIRYGKGLDRFTHLQRQYRRYKSAVEQGYIGVREEVESLPLAA